MKVEQLYTNCLAHGAYYIESNGEAAVIDPLREVEPYIEMAKERGAVIKYVFETHFHADFVSGHQDLAQKTGATVVYGPTTMETGFEALIAEDGQIFNLGDVTIELLHTPGHTTESSCFLLKDENGKATSIFTGDTLFIGDVGRPDLAQKVIAELTQDKLARMLYHSLHNKILPLADDIIVYPGHGAGSACGKNMSKETTDTLGNQKKTNYALQPMSEDEFVEQLLDGLTPPPAYFPQNVLMNIQGYESLDSVLEEGTTKLSIREFETLMEQEGTVVLDTRNQDAFTEAHIPNSIFIGLDGIFASWVGTVLKDVETPIIYIAEEGREEEVATRLARIGFDNTLGYLDGGIEAWKKEGKEVQSISSVRADELAEIEDASIVDVRRASEYNSQHVNGALNAPLDYFEDQYAKLNPDDTRYVHCAGGYRSVIFISLMNRNGYSKLVNVTGGFSEMEKTGKFDVTDYVCPTTML